ncbi:Hsp70 family protein [Micromonospora sp. CPCC 205371]|nr:Hsp70 family protein [Micromonospora sp. CPCC 205371]
MLHLGIDLGSSNTVAVCRGRDGQIRPILFDGQQCLHSGIFCDDGGTLHTGRDAAKLAELFPEGYEQTPKRLVDDTSVWLSGREVPVVELFAAILRRIRDELPTSESIAVTITYPVSWGRTRRRILIEAAAIGGLPNPYLAPEPVAAAVYFCDTHGSNLEVGQNLLIFDFGAGTLDVSVVAKTSKGVQVPCHGGLRDLGGVDLDEMLLHLVETWARQHIPAEWEAVQSDIALLRRLRREVREAKEMLSRAVHAPVNLPGTDIVTHVTRGEFEAAIQCHLDRAIAEVEKVLRQSNIRPDQLAGVLLVGGSSRIPLVAQMLHRSLGIAPTVPVQPELPVAEGALRLASASADSDTRRQRPVHHLPSAATAQKSLKARVGERPGKKPRRSHLRRIVLAVVLTLMVTGGTIYWTMGDDRSGTLRSRVSVAPELRPLSTITWPFRRGDSRGIGALLTDKTFYAVGRVGNATQLMAADLATGQERWRLDLPKSANASFGVDDDVIIIGTHGSDGRSQVSAHEVTTGKKLWQRDSDKSLGFAGTGNGHAILTTFPGAAFNSGGRETEVMSTSEVVSLRTGRRLWQAPDNAELISIGAEQPIAVSTQEVHMGRSLAPQIAILSMSPSPKKLGLLDTETGTKLSKEVRLSGALAESASITQGVMDGVLVLYGRSDSGTGGAVTAFSTKDLHVMWKRSYKLEAAVDDPPLFETAACAVHLVCLSMRDRKGALLIGLDQVSGEERWRVNDVGFPVSAKGMHIIAKVLNETGAPDGAAVFDAMSGKMMYPVDRNFMANPYDTKTLLLEPVDDLSIIGSTRVTVVGSEAPQPIELAVISTDPEFCRPGPQHLACLTTDNKIQVWHLPF